MMVLGVGSATVFSQGIEDQEPSDIRMESPFTEAPPPAAPASMTAQPGYQQPLIYAPGMTNQGRRSVRFTELPSIDLADIPPLQAVPLSDMRPRSQIITEQGNVATAAKYGPDRASAQDLVDTPTPEITAIVDRLRVPSNDSASVINIFNWVRDNIRTEHQPRANKGAHMTLVLGSGGAGDKSALLVSMLRAYGKTPGTDVRYVSGSVKFPLFSKFCFSLAGLTGWASQNVQQGLPSATDIAELNDLANSDKVKDVENPKSEQLAGIHRNGIASMLREHRWTLTDVPVDQNYIQADRVWVRVLIGGEWVDLDTAFPRRSFVGASTEMAPYVPDYDRNTFLNAFAAAPPSPGGTANIPDTGVVSRVGFSNHTKVAEFMKDYCDGFYDLYRTGGDKSDVEMDDILGFLREENPEISSLAELKKWGCPWRIGALGAGITDYVSGARESNFFPVEGHAWVLRWGWGNDGTDGEKNRNINMWGEMVWLLMPAMMGKTFSLEQVPVSAISGKCMVRLDDEKLYEYPVTGTGGSDITVVDIDGIPRYTQTSTDSQPTLSFTNDTEPNGARGKLIRFSSKYDFDHGGRPLSAYAPYAVFNLAASYLHVFSYLNNYSQDFLIACAEKIQNLRDSGATDRRLELESLNLMMATYGYQLCRTAEVAASLSSESAEYLYLLASSGYIGKPTIDVQNYFLAGSHFDLGVVGNRYRAWVKAAEWMSSSLEHSVIQQLHGGHSNKAFSTAKFLARSNSTQPLFVFGPEMSMLQPNSDQANPEYGGYAIPDVQMVNTTSNKFQNLIGWYVANGTQHGNVGDGKASRYLVLPKVRTSSRDGFAAVAYVGSPFGGFQIGGAGGGVSGITTRLNPLSILGKFFSGLMEGLSGVSSPRAGNTNSTPNTNAPNAHGNDPVDMRTGAYIHETTDLMVSAQPPLNFTRYYSSDRASDRSSRVGYGWTHNHIKRLALRSGSAAQFGESGRPEDAATLLTSLLVLTDLMTAAAEDTQVSVKATGTRPQYPFWARTRAIISSAGVATWAADELVDSDVILTVGNEDYRFTRLPYAYTSGNYDKNLEFRPPIGRPDLKLHRDSAGIFHLKRRNAGGMTFAKKTDGYHYCTRDFDAYGNALVYTLSAAGAVTSVVSDPNELPAGPSLTFTYSSDRITQVQTSANTGNARLVLTYKTATSSDKYLLETARPPVCSTTAHKYVYAYTADHRLTTMLDPQGRMIMENFYGGDGRVHRQRSQGLATQEWVYQWLPGMSREINPVGDATEFLFDERSRLVGVRDNEDKLTSYHLDDEDRITEVYGPSSELIQSQRFFSALMDNEFGPGSIEVLAYGYGDPDKDPREGVILSETQYSVWNAESTADASDIQLTTLNEPEDVTTIYEYGNAYSFSGQESLSTAVTTTGRGKTWFLYYPHDVAPRRVTDPMGNWTQTSRNLQGKVTSVSEGNVETGLWPFSQKETQSTYDARGRLSNVITRAKRPTNSGPFPDETVQEVYYNWAYEPHLYEGPSASMNALTGQGFVCSSAGYTTMAEPASGESTAPVIPVVTVVQNGGKMQRHATSGVISQASGTSVQVTTTVYNAFGDVVLQRDGRGDDGYDRQSETQYNALGKVVRVVGPQTAEGRPVSTVQYDSRGWQWKSTDPLNRTTTTTRSHLDRVDEVAGPLNLTSRTYYDSLGRVQKVSSPMLRETTSTYVGHSSQIGSVEDALDHTTSSWFNPRGSRVALTDRNGHQWRFAFDDFGRLTTTRKPTGEMIRQTWKAGRQVLETAEEPSGQTTQFTSYSGDDRLLRRKDGVTLGTSETVFGYDQGLRLVSLQENGKTISRSYDDTNQGQLKSITNERGEVFDYVYGSEGLLRTLIYPLDARVDVSVPAGGYRTLAFPTRKTVRYEYDSHKRLIKVIDWANRTTQYKYDIGGRLRKIIRHNGSICDMDYDDIDRLRELKDSWNADGRLISLFRYGFNNDSHLTSRFAVPYSYGTAGTPFSATYGPDNRLLTVNTQATTHDLDGNLLTSADPLYGGAMIMNYDTRNRLQYGYVNDVSSQYTYDSEGVRMSAWHTNTGEGNHTTTYTTSTHAPLSQVLKRVKTGNHSHVTWTVYGLGLLYEVEPDISLLTPIGGAPFGHQWYTAGEKTLVHHHDQIGNTVAVTDDQQRDVLWVQYDVYGAVVHAESPTQRTGAAPVRPEINTMSDKLTRALSVTPYLFSGQQGVLTDPNGLLYMRARYYHPGLRRFVNPDPIGFEGGSNWYAYAGGNPLMANDPSGLAVRKVGRALGREIVGIPGAILRHYWTEHGTPILPAGGLAAATGVIMNGILGNLKDLQTEVLKSGRAGYFNPSHGFLADVTQAAMSILLLGFGDSLGNGFSEFLHQVPSSALNNVSVHSQATAHTTMQALHGNLPPNANISLNSPAVNRGIVWLVDAVYSGNLHYNQPVGDIANLYTFPLNPFRYIVPLSNPIRAGSVHIGNGYIQPPQ